MERERGFRTIAIIALIVAVAGVSIGFASFSKNLNITVQGDVTPEESNFTLRFSNVANGLTTGNPGGISADVTDSSTGVTGTAFIDEESLTLTDVTAHFKKPGDVAVFKFYVVNTSPFNAYLSNIALEKTVNASCSLVGGGEISTVTNGNAACAGMDLSIDVGGSTHGFGDTLSIATSHSIAARVGSGVSATYSSMPVVLTLTYKDDAPFIDEDMSVEFGDITLEYSTVDN